MSAARWWWRAARAAAFTLTAAGMARAAAGIPFDVTLLPRRWRGSGALWR